MNKPIDLELEDAKQEYVNAINQITDKYNMSMYFLEIIFKDIYEQIVRGKEQELINHRAAWELAQKKECDNNEENNI